MNDNININEVIISGEINSITCDMESNYIKFGMTLKKYSKLNEKVYVSLNVKKDLYNIYKDLFFKGNFIYVRGYNNSYIDKNSNIKPFITVTNISNNYQDIINGNNKPHIRYDLDGVIVWDGKRLENEKPTEEEQIEMDSLIDEVITKINEIKN